MCLVLSSVVGGGKDMQNLINDYLECKEEGG